MSGPPLRVRERGIIFTGANVRGIMAGTKTQTRRMLKPQPFIDIMGNFCAADRKGKIWNWGQNIDGTPCLRNYVSAEVPFKVEQRLWVRETWTYINHQSTARGLEVCIGYDADGLDLPDRPMLVAPPEWADKVDRWPFLPRHRSPIHMPRWASRLTLAVTDVRVERLQDISEVDAVAEGLIRLPASGRFVVNKGEQYAGLARHTARARYADLWCEIHGPGAWERNPWVAAITFKRADTSPARAAGIPVREITPHPLNPDPRPPRAPSRACASNGAMRMPDLNMDDVLRFDPLYAAEKMTGDRYGGDLGFGLAIAHGEMKRRMLRERDDTTLSNDLRDYLRIVGDMGFVTVGEYDFPSRSYGDESVLTERTYLMAHPRWAALLCFDTYRETRVNGGKVYYQWRPTAEVENWGACISSGKWYGDPGHWVGDHDCREALRHNMRRLDAMGEFVRPWCSATRPFLWLHGYNEIPDFENLNHDARSAAYETLARDRILAMPTWAREMFEPVLGPIPTLEPRP